MNRFDRVQVRGYGAPGTILRLERKYGRDGAHVQFDGKSFTDWYPLAQLVAAA